MSSFQCPFCSSSMAISDDTLCKRNVSFESSDGYEYSRGVSENTYSNIELSFYKCPNCNRYTVFAKGVGPSVKDINTILKPQSLAKQFPDYIPKAIRQDYAKILTIMHSIYRTYRQFQNNEYRSSYYDVAEIQATEELGCFIEYLFATSDVEISFFTLSLFSTIELSPNIGVSTFNLIAG